MWKWIQILQVKKCNCIKVNFNENTTMFSLELKVEMLGKTFNMAMHLSLTLIYFNSLS